MRICGGEGISLKTIIDHKERVLRTLKYIDDHLNEPLTVKDLAQVACLSEFHFHRSFRHYLGITVSGYIRGVRLTKAADILKQSDVRIIDLALCSGYETGEAFTKAFKKAFGISPSRFRKRSRHNASKRSEKMPGAFILVPLNP